MPWIECKKHTSIYYDSALHLRCPACLNEILKMTAIKLAVIAFKNHYYSVALFDWIELAWETMSSSSESKEKIVSKRKSAYERLGELQKDITRSCEDLVEYFEENDIRAFLNE